MAKKAKKPISKPKKKGTSKKKKNVNIIIRLLVIVFVIVFVAFFIFKFVTPKGNSEKENVTPKVENKNELAKQKKDKPAEQDKPVKKPETKAVERSIQGTWLSTTGGAVLTMKDNDYQLDFMGVDSDKQITGSYSVDGDLITFVNKKDPCKDVKGLYEVKFNKNEIGFKLKNDECTKRKATLPTEWEWLNTEE